MKALSLLDQLDELLLALSSARAAIACGAPIALAGLDEEMAELARAALVAPASEHRRLVAALSALDAEFDRIAQELRLRRDAELASRAALAYGHGRRAP